jgi:hypothetical protein
MPLPYLGKTPWTSWSREERLFCAVLWEHARRDAPSFAQWLISSAALDVDAAGDWDLGYEVCLYRDFLWQKGGDSAFGCELPQKRTFDLCLFGETAVMVIEAKVCQAFDAAQNADFARDAERIHTLEGMETLDVKLVALASTRYFANQPKYSPEALRVFDGHISWLDVAQRFEDPLLEQADRMYKAKPGELINE